MEQFLSIDLYNSLNTEEGNSIMKQKILIIFIALSVVACGSLIIKDKKKDVAAVSKVHRVAIIAFSQERPTPNKVG